MHAGWLHFSVLIVTAAPRGGLLGAVVFVFIYVIMSKWHGRAVFEAKATLGLPHGISDFRLRKSLDFAVRWRFSSQHEYCQKRMFNFRLRLISSS